MAEFYRLIIGILRQAKSDYIRALKKKDFHKIKELEQFFLSDYGQAMSRDNGEEIIRRCQKLANEKRKKERKK